jgi:hypothetical protein
MSEYRNMSRSEPNLDRYNTLGTRNGQSTDEEDSGTQQHDKISHDPDLERKNGHDEDNIRSSFKSPEMYHGDIAETTLAHRDENGQLARNKASDLTHWQQKQRNQTFPDNTKLVLKPSTNIYQNEVRPNELKFKLLAYSFYNNVNTSQCCSVKVDFYTDENPYRFSQYAGTKNR